MKKLTILAALLAATTSAHAGTVSFEIEGKRVNIEMPPNCSSVSCLKITAPGVSNFNSKRSDDGDENASQPERPDFKGPNSGRFNDDDRASGPGRPGFNGGRRYNDDNAYASREGERREGERPGFKGPNSERFNDDEAAAPERPRFKGGYKSKRFGNDDNGASRPDRDPPSAPVPAAPAPPAEADNAATPPAQTDAAPQAPAPAQVATATPERQPAPAAAEPE